MANPMTPMGYNPYAGNTYNPYGNLQYQSYSSYPSPTSMNIGSQMGGYQSDQTAQQNGRIPARAISSLNDVAPNETPSDGSPALFAMTDRSRIYLREVTQNGTIATSEYVLAGNDQQETPKDNLLQTVLDRLDNIERMLKKNTKTRYKPKSTQQQEASK